jgi:outer membrane protein assembly factor BamD (BamD/ComL family)
MKKNGLVVLLSIFVFLFFMCSEKKSEEEQYTIANDLYNNQEFEEAIVNFKKVIEQYPNGKFTATSIFLIGFIANNYTKDLDEAKKYYQMFIEKYPDHEMIPSAKFELENLGRDVDALPPFKDMADSTGTDSQTSIQ